MDEKTKKKILEYEKLFNDKANILFLNREFIEIIYKEKLKYIEDIDIIHYYKEFVKDMVNIYMEKLKNNNRQYIVPLKLYDAKTNKIIHRREYMWKPYVTISHRWNNDENDIDKKTKKLRNIYEEYNNLRYFWMDTICINQEDENEKIMEIKNMKNYYENSIAMISFSDIKYEIKGKYFVNEKEKHEYEKNHDEKNIYALFFLGKIIDLCVDNNILYNSDDIFKIMNFWTEIEDCKFKDDWISRAWVQQEIILSKNIYIYNEGILVPVPNVSNIKSKFMVGTVDYHQISNSLTELCMIINGCKKVYDVGEAIYIISKKKCLLSQDKIYSMLGLINSKINIEINYKINLKEIYIDLFKKASIIDDFSWLMVIQPVEQARIDYYDEHPVKGNKKSIKFINNFIFIKNKILIKSYIFRNFFHLISGDTFAWNRPSCIGSNHCNKECKFCEKLRQLKFCIYVYPGKMDGEQRYEFVRESYILPYKYIENVDHYFYLSEEEKNNKELYKSFLECILIRNNKAIGCLVIYFSSKIENIKEFLIEKEIEIDLDIDHLLQH